MNCARTAKCLTVLTVVFSAGCAAPQTLAQPGNASSATASVPQALSATKSGPRLYIGGSKISEYVLGSTHPLRSAAAEGTVEAMRTDSLGNLFTISIYGSSDRALQIFDARTLKTRSYSGPTGNSIAIDANNYIYLRGYDEITVLTPGAAQKLRVMRRGVQYAPRPMAFDGTGNLYVGNTASIAVFAPTSRPGYMKYERSITKGVERPVALAIGSSDELFVANCARCPYSQPGKRKDWISVYSSGGSTPLMRFDDGADGKKQPHALAIDSTGRLYVANGGFGKAGVQTGEVAVYAAGGTEPIGTITQGIDVPVALALDPSDNLYVANSYSDVTVYSAGGTQLLQTIKDGAKYPQTLVIASP